MPMIVQRASRGFSLIELIVAMALTALILGGLLVISSALLSDWTVSRERVHIDGRGALVLRALERDLTSWIRPAVSSSAVPLMTQFTPPQGASEGWPRSTRLFLLGSPADRPKSTPGGESAPASVSAIAYSLALQNENNPSIMDVQTLSLYRTVMDSRTAFLGMNSQTTDGLPEDLFQNTYAIDDIENLLASGVVSMDIAFIAEYVGTDLVRRQHRIPPDQPFVVRSGRILTLSGESFGPAGFSDTAKLTHAEISLAIIGDHGMRIMQSHDWNPIMLESTMMRHGQLFHKRIALQ